MEIAIIYTTFMRDELARQTLQSVVEHLPKHAEICVVAQGECHLGDFPVHCINLEHDAGLSAARNAGVAWAHEQGIPYCMITADSIKFTATYDLQMVAAIMERFHYDVCGFDLANRVPWEGTLQLDVTKAYPFMVKKGFAPTHEFSLYKPCDICRNFFLAKTRTLRQVQWDEELKLREHEDFFWRLKQAGGVVVWTDRVQAEYIDSKPPEYEKLRDRMYGVFAQKVKEKWHEQ